MTAIDGRWLAAVLGCETVAFVASWELARLALRTDRWFDVAVAQLTGNAASNVVPAGGPVGAAVQLRVMSEAGFELTRAATSMGALAVLGAVGLLALPVVALPLAMAAGTNLHGLAGVLWVGLGLLVALLVATAAFVRRDAPLERLTVVVQEVRNRLLPSNAHHDLPARVLSERDAIRAAFGERPALVVSAAVGRIAADFMAFYLALLAVGAHPKPIVVLIAFGAANVAGMIPLTPGGLGFVEAGITGTLIASGITPAHAALAVALYRVANTWLPVVAGLFAYLAFRARHHDDPNRSASEDPRESPPIPPRMRRPRGSIGIPETMTRDRPARWRRSAVAAVTGGALVLLSPVLIKVYGHVGEAFQLGPGWLLAIAAVIVAHFVCVWTLHRVILRTSNRFDVAASQLAANATSHVAPAGSAVGAGIQIRMLTIAGFPASRVVTALGAATVLGTLAGYVVLPLGVLIASAITGGVAPPLVGAMWSAAAVLATLLVASAVLATRDRPWMWAARVVAATQRRLGRHSDASELGDRLVRERDLIQGALRKRAAFVVVLAVLQPLTDYAALYLALLAIGAHVNPAAAMAAFVVSNVAGLVPLTPGGLGFVEAGLSRVLTIAGATGHEAHVAIMTYRLAATWLPCLAGFVALILFQRRHRHRRPHHGHGLPDAERRPQAPSAGASDPDPDADVAVAVVASITRPVDVRTRSGGRCAIADLPGRHWIELGARQLTERRPRL